MVNEPASRVACADPGCLFQDASGDFIGSNCEARMMLRVKPHVAPAELHQQSFINNHGT